MRYKVKLLEILLRPSHTHFWLSKTLQLLSFSIKTTFERCYDHFIGGKITATALSKEETLYKIGLLTFTAISRLPGWKTFDVERYCFSLERTRRTQISLSNMGRQMYFYYLEWLFVYNQNNVGYLQITTLQFHYF